MAYLHMVEVTINKEGSLDSHKGLRENQEVGMDSVLNFISYMNHSVKTVRDSCSERKKKIKKQRNIFQTKEQDKTPETGLNTKEIND